MFKFCLSVLCLYVVINNIQRDFNSTYDIVSADPLPKDIQQNEHLSKYDSLQDDDDDDEVLVRVARSPYLNNNCCFHRRTFSGSTSGGGTSNTTIALVFGIIFSIICVVITLFYCFKSCKSDCPH